MYYRRLLPVAFAALAVAPLGAQTYQPTTGWGTGFGIEPFGGRLHFDNRLGLAEVNTAGALAGIHFGRSVALRGYYWRGFNDDLTDTEPIQSYGGEVQFDLLSGIFTPFLLAGGGRIEFLEDYRDTTGTRPDNRTTWIAGGGVQINVADWLSITGAVRDYFLEVPDLVGDESKWESNLQWTVGLRFRFGGTPKPIPYYGPYAVPPGQVPGQPGVPQTAVIPIPTEGGEIRVVYGRDSLAAVGGDSGVTRIENVGTAAAEVVRNIVQSELSYLDAIYPDLAPLGQPRKPLNRAQADTLARRLHMRLHRAYDYLAGQEAAAMQTALARELAAAGVTGAAAEPALSSAEVLLADRLTQERAYSQSMQLREDSLSGRIQDPRFRRGAFGWSGFNVTDGFQFLLGGRLGFRTRKVPGLIIGPEATLGFGSGTTSALVGGTALYEFKSEGARPYAGLGLGVILFGKDVHGHSGSSFVGTPTVGVVFPSVEMPRFLGSTATGWFIEYQAADFFSLNRLLGGVMWRF